MPTVADVLRQYGPAYLERFGATMPLEHKKVLNTIMACRTGQLGMVFYACTSCGRTHAMGRSCGNRHCPTCQQDKTRAWLEAQTDRLLPCPYFLLTFTVPAARAAGFAVISASHTPRCSRHPARRSRPWWPSRSTLAPRRPASSESCIPGAALWSITRTSTTSCRVGPHRRRHAMAAVPCPLLGTRACPIDPVLAPSSATLSTAHGVLARSIPPCGARTGWSTSQAVGDGRASLKYLAPLCLPSGHQ